MKNIRENIPFFLDQIAICLAAGIEFREALEVVTEELPPSNFKKELELTIKEIKQGRTREEALKGLTCKLSDKALVQFADLVELSAETGSPLLPGIRALATALRVQALEEAERKAVRAPFWLLLPLLLAIFPATGLILFTPFLRALSEVWK